MLTSSCKQKGRILQKIVRDIIIENFQDLEKDDVRSTSMGASGLDVLLSPKAQLYFPFATECKNTQKISIWKALKQAENNSTEKLKPLLVFKRNRSKIYACLELKDLMELIKNQKEK